MPGLPDMVQGDEAGEAMNLQNYCELSNVPPEKKKKMKRVKLSSLNKGYHRTWTPDFQKMILDAKGPLDILNAYQKAGSCYGIHSDIPEEAFNKIEQAKKMLKGMKF